MLKILKLSEHPLHLPFQLKLQNSSERLFNYRWPNAMLVTADVVELYPSIPHNEGVEVLKKQIDDFYEKSIPTEDLAKMAEYVLKLTILSLTQM